MTPLKTLSTTTIVLNENHIDTDQIIPARFLTTISRDGLGQAAFADWRFDGNGHERADCVLNADAARQAGILVAGENFGCGSSREHAVWALQQFGFKAVISSRLADIFRANALKNGLLAIEVDQATHHWLLDHPGSPVTIDVASSQIELGDGRTASFELDPFARKCLLEGVDALGYLLNCDAAISRHERGHREAA